MPYLVDGHNLIPKIPGLSLRALDDENELIQLLQEYCRLQRKQVEVYFDNASPGQAQLRKYGAVTARFVRRGTSADQAIRTRLAGLGRRAAHWTVVSSDHAVQSAGRLTGAQVMTAEAFAGIVQQAITSAPPADEKGNQHTMEPDEVEAWLRLFEEGPSKDS